MGIYIPGEEQAPAPLTFDAGLSAPKIEFPSEQTPPVPESTIEARALKYDMALGVDSPGQDKIASQLRSDGDSKLRSYAAERDFLAQRKTQLSLLSGIMQKAPLSPEMQEVVLGLGNNDLARPDLQTILEKKFAERMSSTLLTLPEHQEALDGSLQKSSDLTHMSIDVANDWNTKYQVLQKLYENDQYEQSQRSTRQKVWDFLGQQVPLVSNYNSLTSLPGPIDSFWPGTNKTEKYNYLLSLPPEQFSQEVSKAYDTLKNTPTTGNANDASAFLSDLYGYSSDNATTDNFWAAMDVAGVLPIGTLAKLGIGGTRAAMLGVKAIGANAKDAEEIAKAVEATKAVKAPQVSQAIKKVIPLSGEVDEAGQMIHEGNIPFHGEVDQNVYRISEALKNASKAASKPNATIESVIDASGATEKAADVGAWSLRSKLLDIKDRLQNASPSQLSGINTDWQKLSFEQLSSQIPGHLNPTRLLDDPGHLSSLRQKELLELTQRQDDLQKQILGQQFVVQRTPDAGLVVAAREAIDNLSKDIGYVPLDFREIHPSETVTNTGAVLATFGKRNGALFDTAAQADTYARKVIGIKGPVEVAPYGGKYVFRTRRDYTETSPGVRSAVLSTDNISPESKALWFLQRLQGAKNQVSEFQAEQRATAVHVTQNLSSLVHEMSKGINELGKSRKAALNKVMEANRDYIDPKTGDRGRFYNNVGELEQGYMSVHNRLPSPGEINAYFTATKLNDLDYVLRNLQTYRYKSRLGYQTINLNQAAFDGKTIDHVPFNDGHQGGILVYDGPGKIQYYAKGHMSTAEEATVKELYQKQGYKVVKTFDPTDPKVSQGLGYTGDISFVVTKRAKPEPLSYQQLEYNPGGHVIYRDPYYVKQAQMYRTSAGQLVHAGDITAVNAKNLAQANELQRAFETGRQLIDDPGLAAHLATTLPYTANEFKAMFRSGRAVFDEKVPFMALREGQNTMDSGVRANGKTLAEHFPGLHSAMNSPYNDARDLNKSFLGERDHNVPVFNKSIGTNSQPVLKLGAPRLIDPLTSISNTMQDLIRNRHYEDYQISAAESFLQEFGDVLRNDVGGLPAKSAQTANPIFLLKNAKFSKNIDDVKRVSQAYVIRDNILRLLGTDSSWNRGVKYVESRIADFAYNKFGDHGVYQGIETLSNAVLPLINDPFRYARSIAFHTKLGLFNPIQIFVQGQTMANIVAIAGEHGVSGAKMAMLTRQLALTDSDAVISHYAQIAEKLGGMSQKEFKESFQWLRSSGFDIVGHEHAWRDDVFADKLFPGGKLVQAGQQFLDKGAMFFNGTERFVRQSSWNAAYLEYIRGGKATAGNLKLGDAQNILSRAQDLSGNMTRDASAFWQHGPGSSFTQFFGYQARMIDQLVGNRLSGLEKAKLLTMFGAMYGVPSTLAVVPGLQSALGSVLPDWTGDIRSYAATKGVNLDEGALGYITNGIPAMITSYALGQVPNFGERYGPGGNTLLEPGQLSKHFADDVTSVDTVLSLLSIGLGASGSILGDIYTNIVPFGQDMSTWLANSNTFSPQTFVNDMLDATRTVSSVNQVSKLITALKTGEYLSKNKDTELQNELTKTQAWFYAMTGMQPQEMSDVFQLGIANKDFLLQEQAVTKEIHRTAKLWLEAQQRGDQEEINLRTIQMDKLFKSSYMDPQQQEAVLNSALKSDPIAAKIYADFVKNGFKTGNVQDRLQLLQEKGIQ